MAKIINSDNLNADEDKEKLDYLSFASGNIKWDSHSRKQFDSFSITSKSKYTIHNFQITQQLHYWAFIPEK